MRIQHNIAALNSHRQLMGNNNAVAKNLERLSSGYRINRAGDDAAGLAISEKMRAQITGLDTAQKNAQDGISLVQTAEGALTEVHSMLNRMVELADQSANGTYQDEVDRENLQKEIESLKSEIDRISKSTNFNGIDLLNGKVNEALSVTFGDISTNAATETKTGNVGSMDANTAVDGDLVGPKAEVKFEQKFYIGTIKNTSGNDKTIELEYQNNDGTGSTNKITLTVSDGTELTIQDIANALTDKATVNGVTRADDGDATKFADNGQTGNFNDLYDVRVDDNNILVITAKPSGAYSANPDAEVINGSNLGGVTFTTGFDQTDIDAANTTLKENYAGTGAENIKYGSAAGEATLAQAATTGSYQVASTEFSITTGLKGADAHNSAVTVGGKTYVFQTDGKDLAANTPTGTDVFTVDLEAGDDAEKIAQKLAAAITANEGSNGNYVASVKTGSAGTIIVSESTNFAANMLTPGNTTKPGIGAELISNLNIVTDSAPESYTGELATLDASKISNGTSINVGGNTYTFVADKNETVAAGATKLVFDETSTSEDLAKMLADAITADGAKGVTADGATVKLDASDLNPAGATAKSAGLTLQIGDTSDTFNKLSVQIESTSAASLGIDKVDISTQKGASDAVQVIKNAINSISSTRGDLGAIQNRLEHTINNLAVTSENMTAAESRIRDVDMAKEMMAYTKNNILVQASQAMLAQANQQPQGVLQLLQ